MLVICGGVAELVTVERFRLNRFFTIYHKEKQAVFLKKRLVST